MGGKYSGFEAGTRVPCIISWPGTVKPGVSNAVLSHVDLLASFANMLHIQVPKGEAFDSQNMLNAFLGKTGKGRELLVEQGGPLSIRKGDWKYIEPHKGAFKAELVNIEIGNMAGPQLYNLKEDIGEQHNLADQYPEKVKELAHLLEQEKKK